jgi:hypothetical protein
MSNKNKAPKLYVVEKKTPSGKSWTEVADAKSLNRAADKYFAFLRKGDAVYRLRRRQQKDANGRVILKAHTYRTNAPASRIDAHEGL